MRARTVCGQLDKPSFILRGARTKSSRPPSFRHFSNSKRCTPFVNKPHRRTMIVAALGLRLTAVIVLLRGNPVHCGRTVVQVTALTSQVGGHVVFECPVPTWYRGHSHIVRWTKDVSVLFSFFLFSMTLSCALLRIFNTIIGKRTSVNILRYRQSTYIRVEYRLLSNRQCSVFELCF